MLYAPPLEYIYTEPDQRSSHETKYNGFLSNFLYITTTVQAVGWILLNKKFSDPYFGVKSEL